MEIIHIVLGKANPERMNGVNKVVYQLATEQALGGRNVAVWGITADTQVNYKERPFKTVLFKARKNPFTISADLKKAIENASTSATFHLHGSWIPTFYAIAKHIHQCGNKYVTTPHGGYNTIAMQKNKWVKKFYFALLEETLLKNATTIHCIGESEKEGLNQIYKNNKQVRIPYGFMPSTLRNVEKPVNEKFIIGYVGRIDIYTKGLDLLASAFEKMENRANSELWIIGDSAELHKLEQLITDKKISDNVVFWGSKYGDEKDTLMKQMDVFVHASRNEGLPTAVLEACNFGVPCVVSKATNVGDEIEDFSAGICVPNEDANALAESLNKMYDNWANNEIAPMQQNAKNMVKNAFSWHTVLPFFDALYA